MTTAAELRVSPHGGGARFEVFAKPRASKSAIGGVRDGALVVSLAAPPVDGAANEELVRVLSARLGVKRSAISIASGAHGRTKIVDVADLAPDVVLDRLTASA
jgi:uncharacterized protein (TIGR00251 family)